MSITTTIYPIDDGVCPLYEYSTDWATVRNATSSGGVNGSPNSDSAFRIGETNFQPSNSKWSIGRAHMFFDTSTIPAGAVITAASVNVRPSADPANTNSTSVYLVLSTAASDSTIAPDDYDQLGAVDGGNWTIASFTSGVYKALAFNSTALTWIEKGAGAVTKIGFRNSLDLGNSATASGNNFVTIYGSAAAGLGSDPYLSVTYNVKRTQSIIM